MARWRQGALIASAIALASVALLNIRASAIIGERAGTTFIKVVQLWLAGFEAGECYEGLLLIALGRFETGLVILGFLLVSVVWFQAYRAAGRPSGRWADQGQ